MLAPPAAGRRSCVLAGCSGRLALVSLCPQALRLADVLLELIPQPGPDTALVAAYRELNLVKDDANTLQLLKAFLDLTELGRRVAPLGQVDGLAIGQAGCQELFLQDGECLQQLRLDAIALSINFELI